MPSQTAAFDVYRTLPSSSVTSSFTAVGTPFTHLLRAICITNNTNGDMIFSTDGINNMLFVAANSFKLYDISSDREVNTQFYLPAGTQFYVKESTAPSSGAVYVEAIYGVGE